MLPRGLGVQEKRKLTFTSVLRAHVNPGKWDAQGLRKEVNFTGHVDAPLR